MTDADLSDTHESTIYGGSCNRVTTVKSYLERSKGLKRTGRPYGCRRGRRKRWNTTISRSC